ncbi:unnamed protein product [Fusarium graminearum]|nr:unnamed protein product [Fusarium graminearum]
MNQGMDHIKNAFWNGLSILMLILYSHRLSAKTGKKIVHLCSMSHCVVFRYCILIADSTQRVRSFLTEFV